MSEGFTKLFSSLVQSSLWCESDSVRLVFITMLCLTDRNGIVETSVGGLARAANVSREACEEALGVLAAPDPDDRSGVAEGRRIEQVQGGYRIINYVAYRERGRNEDRREYFRKRKQEERAATVHTVHPMSTMSTESPQIPPIAEADADAESRKKPVAPLALPGVLDTPDFRQAWADWFAYRREAKLKTWKPSTVKAKLAELADLGSVRAVEAIRRSIANGWSGIFPAGNSPKPASTAVKVSKLDNATRAALDRIGRRNLEPEALAGTKSDTGAPVSIQGRLQKTASALPESLPAREEWRERITALSGDSEEIKANLESIGQEIGVPLLSLFNDETRKAA